MPRTRRRAAPTPPKCDHCGRRGHVSNICPRDDYNPDLPALNCSSCVRHVISAVGDSQFEMYCGIDPCILHSTLTAQPPSHTTPSAMAVAMASLSSQTAGASGSSSQAAGASGSSLSAAGASGSSSQAAGASGSSSQADGASGSSSQADGASGSSSQADGASGSSSTQLAARRNNRSYSFTDILSRYSQLTALVNGGSSLADALVVVNVKDRTFRRWRDVAEALLVDETDFMAMVERRLSPTLEDCVALARTVLQRSSSQTKLTSLFLAGACLRPMKKRN